MDITIKKIINILNNDKTNRISNLTTLIDDIESIDEFTNCFQIYLRNNLNEISDRKLVILIKLLILKNLEYFKKNIIINKLKKDAEEIIPETIKFIKSFYTINNEFAKKKIWINYFNKVIMKEYQDNPDFKKINSNKKLSIFIDILLHRLKAIFDRSFGNQDFIVKMFSISKSKNLDKIAFIHEEEICERIRYCYKLVGKEFFEKYNLKVIRVSEFYDYTFLEKCEYMKNINDGMIKIFLKTQMEIREESKFNKVVNKMLLVTDYDFLSDSDSDNSSDEEINISLDDNNDSDISSSPINLSDEDVQEYQEYQEEDVQEYQEEDLEVDNNNDTVIKKNYLKDDKFFNLNLDEDLAEQLVDEVEEYINETGEEQLEEEEEEGEEQLEEEEEEEEEQLEEEEEEQEQLEENGEEQEEEDLAEQLEEEVNLEKQIIVKDNTILILNDDKVNNIISIWNKSNNSIDLIE